MIDGVGILIGSTVAAGAIAGIGWKVIGGTGVRGSERVGDKEVIAMESGAETCEAEGKVAGGEERKGTDDDTDKE